jgi:capsular exopolysaccharide synthesis family protein
MNEIIDAQTPDERIAQASEWIHLPATVDESTKPGRPQGESQLPSWNSRLIVHPDATPVATEQYRRLAAVMHQAQVDRGIKSVMVASALAGEGKTLSATNLALTLSESYRRRVLLIDADLRRPMLHDIFQIPNLAGLSDGLKSDLMLKMPLVEITPQLSVLPGGRPDRDPMSGLTSDRMKRVIQQATERFDWVILDTPPVALLPDGNLVATLVDTVLLVISAGRTPHAAVNRTIVALGRERIIGVVLNFVDDRIAAPAHYASYDRPAYAGSAVVKAGT